MHENTDDLDTPAKRSSRRRSRCHFRRRNTCSRSSLSLACSCQSWPGARSNGQPHWSETCCKLPDESRITAAAGQVVPGFPSPIPAVHASCTTSLCTTLNTLPLCTVLNMSDLQKSFAKAHISRLPPDLPPLTLDERDEYDDEINDLPPTSPNDSSSSASSASSTGTIVPSPSRKLFERPKSATTKASRTSPLPWNDFFAQELYFTNPTDPSITHHAYLTPPTSNGPLIVTHHGAGSSGLSFATFFKALGPLLPTAGILSLDARSHGLTTSSPDTPLDLTLPTLSSDLIFVLESTAKKLSLSTLPPILLIGHSLGGAVISHIASTTPPPTLLGFIVLDIVEGSALDALNHMESYLSTRPTSFPSIPSAIDWHLRSRTIRNTNSARVSVPPLLTQSQSPSSAAAPSLRSTDPPRPSTYTWVTNLTLTRPFWSSWFTSLSTKFLSPPSSIAKLLILAGTDRLDKPLTIAQMQGKYQLQIFPEAGHFVHEDIPEKVAGVVVDFWKRNDRSGLVLPPKVDDLIKAGKVKGRVVDA